MPRWKHASTSSSESASTMSSMSSPSSSMSSASSSACKVAAAAKGEGTVCTHSSNLNYGALTCLSCRAFFRCIIQHKLKQELKCRGEAGVGRCVIIPQNRKKCKKCRFEQCKRVGMCQEAVLNKSQYQRRFRKMISKQQQELIDSQVRAVIKWIQRRPCSAALVLLLIAAQPILVWLGAHSRPLCITCIQW